jgi:hypothetical protein
MNNISNETIVLFAKIALSLFSQPDAKSASLFYSLLNHKAFYIGVLYILLLPNVMKKNVQELKIASYLLFVGVFALISVFIFKILSGNSAMSRSDSADTMSDEVALLQR